MEECNAKDSRHDSGSSTSMGGPSVTGGRRAADRAEPRHRGAAAPTGPAAAARRGQGHSDREEARQHPPVRGQQRVFLPRALLLESRQAVGQRPQLPAHAALQWQFISVG